MGIDRQCQSQIMIIDNDKCVRESLRTFFGTEPLRMLIFKSAGEGLNALKYQDIDLVISDYFLPDMDGLSFLKLVGQEKPGIPRVLMATVSNDEMDEDIVRAGIYKFIEKPLNIDCLETIIEELEILKPPKPRKDMKSDE